jgi:hypothetical protein
VQKGSNVPSGAERACNAIKGPFRIYPEASSKFQRVAEELSPCSRVVVDIQETGGLTPACSGSMQPMKFVAPQANEQMGRDPIFSLLNNRGEI